MNPQQVLESIGRKGWRITGRTDETKTAKVTDASGNTVDQEQRTGNQVWTIAGPNGQTDQIVVGTVLDPTSDMKGGVGYQVVKPPTRELTAGGTDRTVSAPATEQFILTRDPDTGALSATANPNYRPTTQPRDTISANGGVYERQDDGSYKLVISPDKAPRIVGGTAPTDKQLILQDANGTTTFLANPNYTGNKPTTMAAGANDQFILQVQADGSIKQVPNPNYVPPKPTTIGGGSTSDQFILQQQPDGSIKQVANPNYVPPKPTVVSTNTDAPVLTFIDASGKLTTQPNPNYQAPKPEVLNPNTVAPFIPVLEKGADGQWTVKQVANPNQQTVSSAILGLYQGLREAVGTQSDQMPLDTAKELTTMAYQAMQVANQRETNAISQQRNAIDASNNALTAVDREAQTGAGLLQQKAANARDTLNQTLAPAMNSKNFGLGGGLPAGFGAGLLNGIDQWTTQMMGGPDVIKTAQDMVHNANPTLAGTPAGAAWSAVLGQMLQAKQSTDAASGAKFTAPTGTTIAAPTTAPPAPDAPQPAAPAAPTPDQTGPQGGLDWLMTSPASPMDNPANTPGVSVAPNGGIHLHFYGSAGTPQPAQG